ncbi:MAG: hypothetical protein FWC21_06595 [Treponema sp.]|nr:hypothetical protein [Treponema sp.]
MAIHITKYEKKDGKVRKIKHGKNGTSGGSAGSTPVADNKNQQAGNSGKQGA